MRTRILIAALLAPVVVLSAMPARAEMIGTDELLAPSADAQRVQVDTFLAREDVRRQLETLGVSPAEATTRVASLTEAELQVLASRIDALPAGGHISNNTVVLLLVIILIVLLI